VGFDLAAVAAPPPTEKLVEFPSQTPRYLEGQTNDGCHSSQALYTVQFGELAIEGGYWNMSRLPGYLQYKTVREINSRTAAEVLQRRCDHIGVL